MAWLSKWIWKKHEKLYIWVILNTGKLKESNPDILINEPQTISYFVTVT